MRQMILLAGAAALAIGGPAFAQGKGNGGGQGGPPAGAKGGGPGKGSGGGPGKGNGGPGKGNGGPGKGNGGGGGPKMVQRGGGNGLGIAGPGRSDKGPKFARGDRGFGNAGGPGNGGGKGNGADRIVERVTGPGRIDNRRVDDRHADWRQIDDRVPASRFASRQWSDGRYRYDGPGYFTVGGGNCPPGLAKKNNGCLPPGQARQLRADYGWAGWYPTRYRDDGYDWRYGDGYLYRTASSGGLVAAIVPLLGGALFGGNQWPAQYSDDQVPAYYDRFYGYGDNYDYRYADNALFAVDPQSQRIDGIAALLTGDNWSIGQQMPAGYDLYNVPMGYRDRYADSPDNWYRYSDGYVYQVDPTTRLVRGVIELLT